MFLGFFGYLALLVGLKITNSSKFEENCPSLLKPYISELVAGNTGASESGGNLFLT